MLSRIFWVGVAGIAIMAGIALQDGGSIISWDDHDGASTHRERTIDAKVDRAIESSFDKMQVVDSEGDEVDVPAKTKRALADAVGRLVKAEADLAMARIGDDDEGDVRRASADRDRARADIDRLKAEIKQFERAAQSDDDALREQIRREIREDVRESVRGAVAG